MPLHLVKWAAGVESPAHLKQIHAEKARLHGRLFTQTRMVPRRMDDILDGGSLYWVIKRWISVRQPILWAEEGVDAEGRGFVLLGLGDHVPVSGGERRPFQGWRYLTPEDAPADATLGDDGAEPPPEMAAELRALGLL